MSTRTALTVVGGIVGAYFGYPQLGLVVGGLIGGAVDPQKIEGPQINETGVQTSAEGVQRPIIWGTIDVTGNIIQKGPSIKTTTEEEQGKGGGAEATVNHLSRTYAIRICEGPIGGILRIWADNKLVYDMRSGSEIIAESQKWIANKVIYFGDETQTADPTLVSTVDSDTPAYRGSAYIVFILEELTERAGSIPQYRFEAARSVIPGVVGPLETGASNGDYVTDIKVAADGNVMMLRDQTGASAPYGVGAPPNGTWRIATYSKDDVSVEVASTVVANGGDPLEVADQRMGVIGIGDGGYAFSNSDDGTNAGNRLLLNGTAIAHLVDYLGNRNWGAESAQGAPIQYGGLVFFTPTSIYIGISRTGYNQIHKWNLGMGGPNLAPAAYVLDPVGGSGGLAMHLDRSGVMRAVNRGAWTTINEYNSLLVLTGTRSVPSVVPWSSPSQVMGFGVDEAKGLQAYCYTPGGANARIAVFNLLGDLIVDLFVTGTLGATSPGITKILFSDENIFLMRYRTLYRVYAPQTNAGTPALLGDIVSEIYDRCGAQGYYDVSELTDEVSGFVCANAYTGADAISKLIMGYWFDISGHDKKNYHPKRGAAVVDTLTIDDLLELPDTNTREQAIERPKKLHLRYKHAGSGYAPVKATAPRANSPDVLTTGEAIIELPVVLDEDQAARKADVMYKIVSTEVTGETELVVPFRVGAKYVTGNALGLVLRGAVTRQRVDRIEFQPWRIKLTLKPDRQSAYTSNLTGVPIPPPELPPSTIIGETILAVLDISARVDSEDDLNYLVAVSGALPPWYGARYQRSLDGGASYTSVLDISTASIIGELLAPITDASEHFTDTTNIVIVRLYRDSQTLQSISDTEFLSQGNPFALEKADGSWELMQFQEAVQVSDGSWELSILHRGQLNSGTSAHVVGARFVMLQRPSHISAQSAWIGLDLTHRAISFGESADDTDNEETHTFVGRSQLEWEPAYLELERDSSDIITATWVGRGRFGNAFNPVMSVNFQGYRINFDDGVDSLTFDTTAQTYTFDASAMGPSVTVSVSALNRITGAGPASTGTV